ncbi:unnamed protein product [Acidithrix sp. C25]|nr:unnamed protein product [Acidithrix sp. C25]
MGRTTTPDIALVDQLWLNSWTILGNLIDANLRVSDVINP